MPTIRVPVRIDYVGVGAPGYNVWHVRTATGAGGELEGALDALETFYTGIASVYPSTASVRIGESMINDPLGSPSYEPDDLRVVAGGGNAFLTPQMLAIVISWRTTSATRSGRGRTFIGPLTVASEDSGDGTPTAAVITPIRNFATALVAASNLAAGWSFGVLSKKDAVIRDFTAAKVNDRWSYLSTRRD